MNYIGGKHRQGKKISEIILQVLESDHTYVEPFCGALGVVRHVARMHLGKIILNDINAPLIRMWNKLYDDPLLLDTIPDVITNEDYDATKQGGAYYDTFLEAYVAVGMSFGGKWWGGYARENRDSNEDNKLRSGRLKKAVSSKVGDILRNKHISFSSLEFDDIDYPSDPCVIYCDPPYRGKTRGYAPNDFNSDVFWSWCRYMVGLGHIVIITEFSYPSDFSVIHSFGDTTVRHHATKGMIGSNNEVVICHESQRHLFT